MKIKVRKFFKEESNIEDLSKDYVLVKMGYTEWLDIMYYLQFANYEASLELRRLLKEASDEAKEKWY